MRYLLFNYKIRCHFQALFCVLLIFHGLMNYGYFPKTYDWIEKTFIVVPLNIAKVILIL